MNSDVKQYEKYKFWSCSLTHKLLCPYSFASQIQRTRTLDEGGHPEIGRVLHSPLLLLLYDNDRKRNKPLKTCVKVATVPAQMTDHVASVHNCLSKYSDKSFLTLVLHQVPNPTFEIVQKWYQNPTKSFQNCKFH
jgi:hypothetical protein